MLRNKFLIGVGILFGISSHADLSNEYNTYHHKTGIPKLLFVNYESSKNISEDVARDYLKINFKQFGIASPDEFKLDRVKKSLMGEHFYFQQYNQDIKIYSSQIVISVKGSQVFKVYNNVTTNPPALSAKKLLEKEKVYDLAWNHLGVQAQLMAEPNIEMVFQKVNGKLRLVYKTFLAVEKPFGYWEVLVDAQSGEVLSRRDTRITRRPVVQTFEKREGPVLNRVKAFSEFDPVEIPRNPDFKKMDGIAYVFNPDPRTSLERYDLEDDSDPFAFEGAYFSVTLKDLKYDGKVFSLVGPWVQIKDFESPRTKPSKTKTGSWTEKRGNNSFNDVMTYFHIDQNQRYMQSLGFSGNKGIQFKSIQADSDGLGGSDNSHFIPSNNKIAFGHGCVDDNEDADVILHEYGHAINFSINEDWNGGDTGAMGEGFGDYWAGSYSFSQSQFHVDEVFSWDGSGEYSSCWPGRRLNKLNARYDHDEYYTAHSRYAGFISDELWSTPLFQTLKKAVEKGLLREDIDKIILEAQFGMGSDIKMRDMALAIVKVAETMFPNDEYADIFRENFVHHKIINGKKRKRSPLSNVAGALLSWLRF